MNRSLKISALASIFLSSLFLATGLGLSGQWVGLGLALVVLALWLGALQKNGAWLAAVALVATAALAAIGLLANASPYLMLPGVTLALAGWDLTLFEASLDGTIPGPTTARLVRKHFASLALVMAAGLLALAAGRLVSLQIPFILLVAIVIGLTLLLERVWRGLG